MVCISYIIPILCLFYMGKTLGMSTEETLDIVLKEVDTLRSLVLDLQKTVNQQDFQIKDLMTSRNEDRAKLRKLEIDYRDLKANITVFRENQAEEIQSNITKKREHFSPVSSVSEVAKERGNREISTIQTRREIGEIIAFYAYMSSDLQPGIHHTIPFDVAVTNAGNGYHHNTGVFIAPESGLYVFTWTIRMTLDSAHSMELVVNNVVYGATFMRTHSPEDQNISGTVVVHVNQNDDVYVRTHQTYPYNAGNIRSDEFSRSTFAGWKLN